MHTLEFELDEAQRHGQKAEVQRISRTIAGTGVGVRRIRTNAIPWHRMTQSDLIGFATDDATEGGLGATIIDYDSESRKWFQNKNEFHPSDSNTASKAKTDYFDVIRAMKYATKRRASPEWSLPVEVFLMAMDPGYVSTAHKPRSGVGTMKLDDNAAGIGPTCVQRSVALFNHVHRAQYAPIVANKSKAFFQPKKNGKNANPTYHLPTVEALLQFQNQAIQKNNKVHVAVLCTRIQAASKKRRCNMLKAGDAAAPPPTRIYCSG